MDFLGTPNQESMRLHKHYKKHQNILVTFYAANYVEKLGMYSVLS